jgi:GTP-binding protein LepA
MDNIRNFCIIAHIDHGKSTIADRLLERTGTITPREMKFNQVLDDMDLEQERGITIKLHAIQMHYQHTDGAAYILNLIDTPGHVDFSYEVSRSLAACEGAILVVDASQGVEAQTISNLYLAIDAGLEIIPVINKIDLPSAMIDTVRLQIRDLIGCRDDEIILASAKANIGIDAILDAVVHRVSPPLGDASSPLRALIFDSVFDVFRGSVVYIRVVDGTLREGEKVMFLNTGNVFEAEEVGVLEMKRMRTGELAAGNVGYLIAGVKDVRDTKVGDTVTHAERPAEAPLPGYKDVKPMVFSGVYPTNAEDFEDLRSSIGKLQLNDSSLIYEPETSTALGFGFRCGFLGLLHMEIVQERLEREYNQNIINTVPNVEYRVTRTNGEVVLVDNPSFMPALGEIERVEEPFVKAQIIVPTEYVGNIIFDFYDKLKSTSRGYASFDYEFLEFRESDLVKLDILLNGESVDAFSCIVHKEKAHEWGKKLCVKLRKLIPRQMFEVAIQAAIGSKVVARETISAMRKNVLAKCYGGDITRKRKLLEKQKEGKKRMKQVGRVEIPQEAFLAVLSMDDE